jgi:predicted O-linked N-acetylglucosamine transferase (SPINDLY family)
VVGYASFDLNEHPTAHMVEGLFVGHDADAVQAIGYSYGKGARV